MKRSLISPSAVVAAALLGHYLAFSAAASAQTTPSSAMAAGLLPPKDTSPSRAAESPAPKDSDRQASIQAEVEAFVKSLYRDMEQDDPAKVLANFADTVDYYSYGPQGKPAIAQQLRQYFTAYPSRSFTVGEVKIEGPPSKSRKLTATCEVLYKLKDAQGTASTGRSNVELDLIKPDKIIKIVRFNGTSIPDTP